MGATNTIAGGQYSTLSIIYSGSDCYMPNRRYIAGCYTAIFEAKK